MMIVFRCGCRKPQKIPQHDSITSANICLARPIQEERDGVFVPHLHFCANPMAVLALLQGLVVNAQAAVRGRGPEVDGLFVSVRPHIPAGFADISAVAAVKGHTPVIQNTFQIISGNIQAGDIHFPYHQIIPKFEEEFEPIEGVAAQFLHRAAACPGNLQAHILPASVQDRDSPVIEPVGPAIAVGHFQLGQVPTPIRSMKNWILCI